MARIKKQLKDLFDECKTLGDVFKTIGEAKKLGFTIEEINLAASYRKNSLAKENSSAYKPIEVIQFNLAPIQQVVTTNIEVRNLPSNKLIFDGQKFIL